MDKKLLALLVCPLTRQPLEYDAKNNTLISKSAKLVYSIKNNIPILLPDQATPLNVDNK